MCNTKLTCLQFSARQLGIVSLFLCLFLSLVLSLDAAEQSSIFTDEAAAADIKVSQADPAKIIIDVKITAFQREIVQVDQKEYSRISLSNSTTTSAVGKPELPVIRELLALPCFGSA
jgi:hypothetical protein